MPANGLENKYHGAQCFLCDLTRWHLLRLYIAAIYFLMSFESSPCFPLIRNKVGIIDAIAG
jgi:hypothetical protein